MRQPEKLLLNPSKTYPWYGWCDDGEELTRAQVVALAAHRIDRGDAEIITVRRSATDAEMWWPIGQAAPVFEFPCPVLERLLDGRIKVIAPNGDNKIVLADGWVRHPRGPRRY